MSIAKVSDGVTPHHDILIVGAGIAGLYTALKLAPRPVTIITSSPLGAGGSSPWAQGGLAAAMAPDDSAASHIADTMAAGAGLVDPRAAAILCEDGPACVEDLANTGVPFDRTTDGGFALGREAAHTTDRIVHVGGDEAGATIMRVLADAAQAAPHITIHTNLVAYRILTGDGRVVGLSAWDRDRQHSVDLSAHHVALATGGAGGLFEVTTNPLRARGHGLAMAYEAGAALRDIEFVQFHPTGIDIGRDPAPLATEALRGDGATLRDAHGERFMTALHPDAELAPRDIVARGVADAIAHTGAAFLDCRSAIGERIKTRYPTVYSSCADAGIDPITHPIPVAPAAHYHMGGVMTDHDGQSTLPGLSAIGEVASTGVHGANRLASNSLLEAVVFGGRVAQRLLGTEAPKGKSAHPEPAPVALPLTAPGPMPTIRKAMASTCGLRRSHDDLTQTAATIDAAVPTTEGGRLARLTAELVVKAALFREESRGAHQRLDFPDIAAPNHTLVRREGEAPAFSTVAVSKE